MRLNWFSPLPPAKSGIAGYTARILPALQERAEIMLWTDQDEWDSDLENVADVRHYQVDRMPWADLNRADASIYHIGNNPLFHTSIWQVSCQQPGVVILHDLCLQNLFAGIYRDRRNDRAGYAAQLERFYGWVGGQDADAFWNDRLLLDYMVEHYPLTPLAVNGALGVLVHTQEGQDLLQLEGHCPVVYAPLPYPASPRRHENRSATKGLGTRDQPYRIVVFGHLDVNRRLDALLEALAGIAEKHRFRLDLYGQLWNIVPVRGMIQSLGLQRLVTIHGFVPKGELEAALAAADLAVNLRFPTMGEASLSQLQIWDHALPTLVTRVGWYASLPEDAVAFVRPECEIMDIQAHLRAFLADPGRFTKMGENGRRILEKCHTAEAYAAVVMSLAAAAQRFRPLTAAHNLAKRVGAELKTLTGLTVPLVVSQLWEQYDDLRPQESDTGQQAAALQGIRQAVVEHLEKLRRQRAVALQGIRQALAEQLEQLRR